MSSTYRAICLGHDPAIVIHGGWENSEWNNPADAQTAVRNRSGALALHAKCDLVIGRYSSPLIEVGCPAGARHPRRWHPHTTEWVDIGWLRLALAAVKTDNQEVLKAAGEVPGCWLPERVGRLRGLLVEEDEFTVQSVNCEECQ